MEGGVVVEAAAAHEQKKVEQKVVEEEELGDLGEQAPLQPLQVAYAYHGETLLEKAGTQASKGVNWLRSALGTASGTRKVYEWMQLRVEDASFLKCLEESRGWSVLSTKSKEDALNAPALKEVEEELLDKKQQSEDDDDENASRANGEEAEGLSEGWELVEKEEVLDAMAMFIAAYIQAHPQASKLTPVEIQKALSVAFKELRKSKVVLLWEWSSTIWRAGAMSYGAFSLYTQPWIVRAALQAMWCGSKLVIGATATAIGLL